MILSDPRDRLLVEFLRDLPRLSPVVAREGTNLFARADAHGVSGVLHDALRRTGATLDPAVARAIDSRAVASELDYLAHLAMLDRLDAALAASSLRGVVLKGALFARRFYERPSSRATTDIDLLVTPDALARAEAAVRAAGYEPLTGPREEWFRKSHHHLHFLHPNALPLELHFHAYRGFGRVLPSGPLLARSGEVPGASYQSLAVLAPEDELVYLAVHAAAHRFARLGWLYDCKLLLATMSEAQLVVAAERAADWGYARPLALAMALLVRYFDVPAERVRALGTLSARRRALLLRIVAEPSNAVLKSATRFVYSATLAPTPGAALRYATSASIDRVRGVLGIGT